MITIEFNFNQSIMPVQGNLQDKFQTFIDKYCSKSCLPSKRIYFLGNGQPMNPEKTIESQIHITNEQNTSQVLVCINDALEEKNFIESKEIVCPKCYEPCKYKINNYKIKLFDCMNNHLIEDMKLKDFPSTQKINVSNILCEECKIRDKGLFLENDFFKCLTCSKNLCPLCKSEHPTEHQLIIYDQLKYKCPKHLDYFNKYCQTCKKNLCSACKKDHNEHSQIDFGDLIPDTDKLKNKLKEIENTVKLFNDKIKLIIEKLNELTEEMNIYYKMKHDLLDNYNIDKKNYYLLKNLEELNVDDIIFEKMKSINKIENLVDIAINMFDIYDKINSNFEEINKEEKTNKLSEEKKILENKLNMPKINNNENLKKSVNINKEITDETIDKFFGRRKKSENKLNKSTLNKNEHIIKANDRNKEMKKDEKINKIIGERTISENIIDISKVNNDIKINKSVNINQEIKKNEK